MRAGFRAEALAATVSLLTVAAMARGEATAAPSASELSGMAQLSQHGLHDLGSERWNAYAQATYISSWKLPYAAAYTNVGGSPNSLTTEAERSFTGSATLMAGARLWRGAEAYVVPELIMLRPLSGLHGLGGSIQNFELQKTGSERPTLYLSRAYVEQTLGLGGAAIARESAPMQLARQAESRRLTLRAGVFSLLDVFEKNAFTSDPRQQFFNMAFMTYAAYDFAADARGYSFGASADFAWDDWGFRIARMAPPKDPNSLAIDRRILTFYGDQIEGEHRHTVFGMPGAVRVLAYRNHVNTGRFDDAVAAFGADASKNATACASYNYGSRNATAPDLCWVRKPNDKLGVGVSVEQALGDDVGLFARAMVSDGQSEVYAFNAADSSLSFGLLAHGSAWKRPRDSAGTGVGFAWISAAHARYLELGGVDGFVGDGRLRRDTETVLEAFYKVNVARPVWISLDIQHIVHPGFNADRGHVEVVGARVHAEM